MEDRQGRRLEEGTPFYELAGALISASRMVPRLTTTGALTRSICDYPPDSKSQSLLIGVAQAFSRLPKGGSFAGSVADLVPLLVHARAFDESFFTQDLADEGWSEEKIQEFLEDFEHLQEREALCRTRYAAELEKMLAPSDIDGRVPLFFAPRGFYSLGLSVSPEGRAQGVSDEGEDGGGTLRLGRKFALIRENDWYWLTYKAAASSPGKFVRNLSEAAEALLGALYAVDVVKLDDAGFHHRAKAAQKTPATDLPSDWQLPASLRLATQWSVAVEPGEELSEFERRTLERLGLQGVQIAGSHVRGLQGLFGEADFSRIVRQGARFYCRAVTAAGPGELYSNCGICLEALLLGARHDGVQARLAEAVAHVSGPDTPEVMKERRDWVRALYTARSEWVHQGRENFGVERELETLAVTGSLLKLHLLKLGDRAARRS